MVRNGSEFNEQKPFGEISLNIIRSFFFLRQVLSN